MTRPVILTAGLLITLSLIAQTPSTAAALHSEPSAPAAAPAPQGPKNIKVLTGLSQAELIRTMHVMRASLGVRCEFCHVETPEGIDFASDANEHKGTAREMIELVKSINDGTFEGRPVVGCYTCHQGSSHPSSLVPLPQTLPPPASDQAATPSTATAAPTAESIITAYMKKTSQARVANRTLRGTMTTGRGAVPVEIIQSAEGTTVTTHGPQGDTQQFFSVKGGWISDARGRRDLTAADSAHAYEAHLGLDLPLLDAKAEGWGKPRQETIGDVNAWRIDRRFSPSHAERFWFDQSAGLLLRWMKIESSPVGRVPAQVDYADYRDVGGVQVPFSIRTSLVDVRNSGEKKFDTIEYADAKRVSREKS